MEIRDAAELRVKESDRIAAVVENLRRMGASVEEFPDGFKVDRSQLTGAVIDSFGDHRIAMAFGIAGLLADGVGVGESLVREGLVDDQDPLRSGRILRPERTTDEHRDLHGGEVVIADHVESFSVAVSGIERLIADQEIGVGKVVGEYVSLGLRYVLLLSEVGFERVHRSVLDHHTIAFFQPSDGDRHLMLAGG